MAKIAETFYPLTLRVWKNSSVWPPSCKRQKAAGESLCFISGDSEKKSQGCSWLLSYFRRVLPQSSWFIHAPPGAGKSTCLVLTGFAGCSGVVGIVLFLLLDHIGAVISQQLHAHSASPVIPFHTLTAVENLLLLSNVIIAPVALGVW